MNDLQQRLASLSPAQRALLEERLSAVGKPLSETPQLHSKRPPDRPARLSFAQQRLWFLDQLSSGNSPYKVPTAVRLSGSLDVRCLEQSINAVVKRHEVLRTTIKNVQGEPFQIVADGCVLRLAIHDLSMRPEAEKEPEASRVLAAEAQRPFDLAQDLMLRATLIKLSELEHILLLVMHHIASDGWSMGILMRELSHFYEAETSGRPRSLPELPIQYADYAEWQLEWLRGAVLKEQLDYWKQQLAGAPTRLDLPTDRPRPAVQTFQGASRHLELSPDITQGLKALSLRERASLFMTLLAAFQVLLFRHTGQDDIVLGSPIAGRNRGEVEELIGFFVNTLALRTDLSGDPTFLEVLRRVREVALEAYDHQDLPFERLVEDLQAGRSLSHNPLFQVMFVLQNAPSSPLKLSGLQASPMRLVMETAHFDLTMSITERRPGLIARLSYSTDLFEDATIERMLGHFQVLLEGIVKQPQQRISQLPLLTRGEWCQLRQWNDTNREYPRDRCLAELFEAQVERRPEAVAVVCEERQVSYQELNRRANQLGHYLKRRGVGPEVRVGICVDRPVEMVVGLLGIVKAGGAYVPLDRAYPGERLNYMIRDAGMTVLLTEQQVLDGTLDAKIGNGLDAICLDRDWSLVSRESETNPGHSGTAETLAYIMYTSGSTGQPKGVGIPQRAVSRLVLETSYARLGKEEVLLQMAPTSFDASTFELWGALLHGSRCVLYPGGLPNLKTLGQVIDRHRVTTLWLTASLFNTVIDDAPEILRPIRQLLIGGEALSVTHVHQANERLPNTQIINGYGPTENTTFTCCYTIPKVLNESRSIPIGTAIANTQVYLLDRYLNPVPVGVVGELYTGGEGLARGYWGRADLTAERFVPSPFAQTEGERLYRTGDLARYLPDGSIEFIGRVDNQVKIRGFRIELGDIEAVLSRHSSVEQAVVICREHDAGKRLVAYVVSRDRHLDEVGELRSFLSKKLPEYMLPSAYVLLDALPLTASGKVDRRGLPAVSELDTVSERGYLAARNEVERELTKIWEELLGVERTGVRDNFFELGGHSLLATRLIARIEKRLGGRISLANLFQSPTIESLAEELQEQKGVTRPSWMPLRIGGSKQLQAPTIQPRERAGQPALPSFAQQRLWFLDQLLPGRSPYNIPTAFRLSGLLDIDSLERSLNAVIRRHEVLRTVIESLDGKPFQIAGTSRPLELAVHDLSLRPEGEREAEASRLLTQQAQDPFDLARDLMLRATLIKLSEQEHILLLVMHHIASDGWSMGILMRELSQFYEAETSGHPSSLPELPIQYADYAEWQLEWLQGKVLNEQLDYWKQQLAGVPTRLDLPTDRPRPTIQTFRGASRQLELSPELTQRLKALSVREKASLFMTLLAAFQVLLLRYTGQEDIVVGSPIAGRNRGEVEELIGFFVNTLALRTDLSGDPTFLDVLRRVKEVALKAYEYQDLPFERLVEDLQSERSLSHNPLFQVMFVLQNAPSSPLKLSGLQASPVRLAAERAHFDLTLSITERRQRLTGRLSYSTDLFEEATIKRMLGHLEVLLEGIVKRPEERISRLPLLTREEWSQLRQWNETRREYPRDRCIQELFEDQVERTPQSVALAFGNEQLKYDDLNRRANQLAHYLRATGVGPEVLVGVYLERSVQQIVALLGILKAGGAYLPLDSTYPKQRLTFMLNDAGASVLLTERRFVAKLPSDRMKVLCLDEIGQALSKDNTQNPQSGVRAENLVYVIYTSGSTGQPKGIAVTHQAVVRLVVNTDYVQIEPGDVVAQVSNSSFDAATFEIWGALLHGARLVGLPKDMVISPEAFASSLVQQRISVLFLTTALFNQVSREKPAAFATVRHLLFGGETVEPRCVQDVLRDHPPGRLLHVYGPTETTTFASWYLVTPPLGQTIPIGQPIANTQLHILDRWSQPVPVGVAGELYVGGDGLARGYLNRPELTAEKFVPDPLSQIPGTRVYRTGDLARFLPDGSIEFVGRIDNQVKIRGLRIELGEIEFVLKQHEAVRDAVVAVRQDDEGEKRLVGYVVVRSERSESSRKGGEIREFLRARLPDYMVPGSFVELENLPLTSNGKIDHAALLAASESNMRAEAGYVGGRDEVERKLIRIWEELLHVRPIGVKDNFFELGGHSLLATRLIARIEKTLGSVSLSSLFQSPTIESLARELRQKKEAQGDSALVLFRNGGSRPPLFLHGGSFELSRYLGEDQPCYGIRPHGQDGRRAPATVEEMAADYLKEIRGVQPQGPYLIGGFSFGGLVAYEMAQQLRQSGQEVGLLVLIDPTPPRFSASVPQHPGNGSIARPSSTLNRHMTALRQSDLKPLVAALRSRSQRLANALKMRVCCAYLSFGQRIPSNLRMFYFFEVSGDAARSYVPRSYQGRAVLLSSQPNAANLWRNLVAGTLEVQELQGHHLDAIKGPRVELWARQLRSSLKKALR